MMTGGNTTTTTALHWIGGAWVDGGEHRDSVDPATGQVIGSYAVGGAAEAERAIAGGAGRVHPAGLAGRPRAARAGAQPDGRSLPGAPR